MTRARLLDLAEYALIGLTTAFLCYIMPWDDLLAPTVAAGGDMASHFYPTKLMHEELLPAWRLTGWTMGNYAGFPIFHFYSILPFAVIAALGYVFPLEQTFKIVSILGPLTLPASAAYMFRCLGYRNGVAAIAGASLLPFLFQQGNSMWGGNIPSVLAGEFCHAIGLSLSFVFIGVLHRTVNGRGSWTVSGLLLAAIGLTHAFSFIGAVWFSVFYLWPGKNLRQYGAYLAPMYLLTFFLLAFWGLPLPPRLQFTTEFSMIWRLKGWTEVVPALLWPATLLSLANLLAITPRPRIFGENPNSLRSAIVLVGLGLIAGGIYASNWTLDPALPSNWVASVGALICWIGLPANPYIPSRHGLLLFGLLGSAFLYLIAPAVGFPDIRFVPIGQMFVGLFAADFLGWVGSHLRYRTLYASIVVLACIGWSWDHLGYLPSWLTWNYAGYERKAPYPTFEAINDHLRGDVNDPRVVFEHSQVHNRFGSSRAFENLPLFSGRSTLEGVFHQVSPNSAHVFYIQSQTSEKTSGPFPQHTYIRLDPMGALPRLKLFNVSDLVVVSEKAKKAYAEAPAFEKTFSEGSYEVYHVAAAETGYVVAATHEPVLYTGESHKLAFYRWFKHSELLDIPVIAAKHVEDRRLSQFEYRTDAIERLPRVAYDGDCEVESKLEQYRVTFQTTCPGRPHIVKVSYFPRWKARDGSPVDFIAPGFMLVWPKTENFELYYGRNALDLFSTTLSLLGLAFALLCLARPQIGAVPVRVADRVFGPVFRIIAAYPTAFGSVLLLALVGAGVHTRYDLTEPDRAFREGQDAYRKRDFQRAIDTYGEWTKQDRDTFKHATALFQLGVSYAEADQPLAAVETLKRLQFQFPNVNYGPGTLFHLARSYAALDMQKEAKEAARALYKDHADTAWTKRLAREYPRLAPKVEPKVTSP